RAPRLVPPTPPIKNPTTPPRRKTRTKPKNRIAVLLALCGLAPRQASDGRSAGKRLGTGKVHRSPAATFSPDEAPATLSTKNAARRSGPHLQSKIWNALGVRPYWPPE